MRIFQLRLYTLKDEQSLNHYKDEIYPRHLESSKPFNITVHGIWTSPDESVHKLYVLVSYPDGTDLAAVEHAYMQSPDFLGDMRGFDVSTIVDVTSIQLEPSTASPLR
ncbi:NIPSNAP family containing protein [Mycolicibacterium rhodesiae JS60]|nr:NIPSNAP family containing protein [Mycolicibacterium rhodesiae JS60]